MKKKFYSGIILVLVFLALITGCREEPVKEEADEEKKSNKGKVIFTISDLDAYLGKTLYLQLFISGVDPSPISFLEQTSTIIDGSQISISSNFEYENDIVNAMVFIDVDGENNNLGEPKTSGDMEVQVSFIFVEGDTTVSRSSADFTQIIFNDGIISYTLSNAPVELTNVPVYVLYVDSGTDALQLLQTANPADLTMKFGLIDSSGSLTVDSDSFTGGNMYDVYTLIDCGDNTIDLTDIQLDGNDKLLPFYSNFILGDINLSGDYSQYLNYSDLIN